MACATSDEELSGDESKLDVSLDGTVDFTPANWDVDADPNSPSPGKEPLNVIVTIKGAQFTDLMGAHDPGGNVTGEIEKVGGTLNTWKPVDSGAGHAYVEGIKEGEQRCISIEKASIEGAPGSAEEGTLAQERSYRLNGCLGVTLDGESHVRAWEAKSLRKCRDASPEECKAIGREGDTRIIESTWYLAVSQEHVCRANVEGKDTPWHCILPHGFVGGRTGPLGLKGEPLSGPLNSITPFKTYRSESGGYNQGRDDFIKDLEKLPSSKKTINDWAVDCSKQLSRPAGAGLKVPVSSVDKDDPAVEKEEDAKLGTILKRVTWDDHATHCVLTAKHRPLH